MITVGFVFLIKEIFAAIGVTQFDLQSLIFIAICAVGDILILFNTKRR